MIQINSPQTTKFEGVLEKNQFVVVASLAAVAAAVAVAVAVTAAVAVAAAVVAVVVFCVDFDRFKKPHLSFFSPQNGGAK